MNRNIMALMPNEGKSRKCPKGKLEKYKIVFEGKQANIKMTKQKYKQIPHNIVNGILL